MKIIIYACTFRYRFRHVMGFFYGEGGGGWYTNGGGVGGGGGRQSYSPSVALFEICILATLVVAINIQLGGGGVIVKILA